MLRNGHDNGQERWTGGKVHAINDQRSEAFAKSRTWTFDYNFNNGKNTCNRQFRI